jgi:transcription-repair coupling factor (superfamily II helicase)
MRAFTLPAAFAASVHTEVLPAAAPAIAEQLFHAGDEAVGVILLPGAGQFDGWLAALRTIRAQLRPAAPAVDLLPLPPPVADSDDEPAPQRLREDIACDRLAALTRLAACAEQRPAGRRLLLLTTPEGIFAAAPPRTALTARELRLRPGATCPFQDLRLRLAQDFDYDAEAVCEQPGQFAVRGGLIDVYPCNGDTPVRLDFFGDQLESIRAFDPATQRSLAPLAEVVIAGRLTHAAEWRPHNIHEYFGGPVCWILADPDALAERHPGLFTVYERISDSRVTLAALAAERAPAGDRWLGICDLPPAGELFGPSVPRLTAACVEPDAALAGAAGLQARPALGSVQLETMERHRRQLLQAARAWSARGERVLCMLPGAAEIERLREWIADTPDLAGYTPECHQGWFAGGFRLAGGGDAPVLDWHGAPCAGGVTVLTDRELFGRGRRQPASQRQRLLSRRAAVDQLLDFAELAEGDLLVHLAHGICRYHGMTSIDVRGRPEDVISVSFAEDLVLHVPLQESHLLSRYVGLSKVAPRLSRLGGPGWAKARRAAELGAMDFAAGLLETQAARNHEPGHAFAPDNHWQGLFEGGFSFTETPDQHRAIVDTKRDMEQPRPMERLICGDVGFGKTEVALRAAFKAVMDGRQVAVLAPTTVLAQQHFETFRARASGFPVVVEMLSRFRTAAQQAEILRQLAAGTVDIVIGTHRLLSGDVRFAQLGLLVIDEEHRFGVRHKERLKQLKRHVDVLSMSATPIPRTLYLALMGARDMSVIETPPVDRHPIETVVRAYDPELVKRAVTAELERDGQVFYLHNRVQSIEAVALRLREWFPKARIAVGHGQMAEATLERVMTHFVAGQYDILVCTTIIESGIDIPNCNTIIIEGADRFGLAQLYQLRGRVGRFHRQAYAYLLLHRHARVLDLARQRLSAIRQHNQLGAGFRIAMRDLELRGAGNLLGARQSGHIAGVGFDLYCQLLRQSVRRLKGDPAAALTRATVKLDFILQGAADQRGEGGEPGFRALRDAELRAGRIAPAEAGLPAAYIAEPGLRIDFHRRLALAATPGEVEEVGAALADRFGPPPPAARRLLGVARIRALAEQRGFSSVESVGNRLQCLRAGSRRDDYYKLGARFPRLTGKTADLRLREVERFLLSHGHTT